MAAPADTSFDPLVEFAGMWDTHLAERHLPYEGLGAAKYDCLGGRLILSLYESAANAHAAGKLYKLLDNTAETVGYRAYLTLNLQFSSNRWIQPDVSVLSAPAKGELWVPAAKFVVPVECVSPSSRRRDRIDKPALCASS
ncbi:Uma2 family endonuclease [Streptoalloteichus hindustanus]|uniref:Putative restriction endonuclease n=1 Tax=Streptoalloteichus hindustanus TaxID=2017 RepID=A0A1M5GAA0_STRHI|nr:Uma2 family endonuclease [Streptoalloteichus hindustanus]SHG00636.1 Putative restriction endonuclease [Streptoalloteichus hindustanus]